MSDRILKKFGHKAKNVMVTCGYCLATCVSPVLNTQLRFIEATGHRANLKCPQTFTEKISWLKLFLYSNDSLVKQCSDKLAVRDYVCVNGLGYLLNDLIAIYERPEDIPWEQLPKSFVLKWNFGCGYNLLCPDKDKISSDEAISTLKKWQRQQYWMLYSELQYRVKKKYIICERFIKLPDQTELLDYKFYCFEGVPKAVLVISREDVQHKRAVFMTTDWQYLSDIPQRYSKSFIPDRPISLEKMVQAAAKLSKPFPFVRVDLYEWYGRPIFGEMTFTPGAGIYPSETLLNGKNMGDYIKLEDLR